LPQCASEADKRWHAPAPIISRFAKSGRMPVSPREKVTFTNFPWSRRLIGLFQWAQSSSPQQKIAEVVFSRAPSGFRTPKGRANNPSRQGAYPTSALSSARKHPTRWSVRVLFSSKQETPSAVYTIARTFFTRTWPSEPARREIPFALFADLATVLRCFEQRLALETR